MILKQKTNLNLLWSLLFLLAACTVPLFGAPSAYADPVSKKVVCADGTKRTANKADKPNITILDNKDFNYACRNNGGYKKIDGTVTCDDNTVQNVYKDLADPKNTLNKKDRQAACTGHGGIQQKDKDKSPKDEGVDACKTETSIIPVDCSTGGNPIWGLLILVINILTAGIGIVAIGGIIYAAILWTTAEDKQAQIVKSKTAIFNVVVGLVAFALLWAFLQFLIPGGVFSVGP